MSNEIKPYRNRGTCAELEPNDMTAILDTIIDSSIKRMGRPANYPPDAAGLELFIEKTIDFFEHVRTVNAEQEADKRIIPDIEAWSQYIGITRQTLWSYEQRGGEWKDTIAYYKNAIAAVKKQLALTYKIPPMVAIFDLTNNHHYYNTSEYRLTTQPAEKEEERPKIGLKKRAQLAGLVWDSTAGEFIGIGEGGGNADGT